MSAVASAGALVTATSAFLWCCALRCSLCTCSDAISTGRAPTWTQLALQSSVCRCVAHSTRPFSVWSRVDCGSFHRAFGLGTKQTRNSAGFRNECSQVGGGPVLRACGWRWCGPPSSPAASPVAGYFSAITRRSPAPASYLPCTAALCCFAPGSCAAVSGSFVSSVQSCRIRICSEGMH